MADFKDKLTKKKKIKVDCLEVIFLTYNDIVFCEWISQHLGDLYSKHIFSLKRIAKMFLAENPGIYIELQMNQQLESENIRLAQDHSCWEDD